MYQILSLRLIQRRISQPPHSPATTTPSDDESAESEESKQSRAAQGVKKERTGLEFSN
jgi:hypothetical protein